MRKQDFEGPDVTYRFDIHRVGYGTTRHIAINVKHHDNYKISEEHLAKLKAYADTSDGPTEEHIRAAAWEDVSTNWWDWAQMGATTGGLGKIHSEGRSGGWLVLNEWTTSKVEELLEDVEDRCQHCDCREETHVNGACLFASTKWTPVKKVDLNSREMLDRLEKYVEVIEGSLKSIDTRLKETAENLIDDLDQNYGEESDE